MALQPTRARAALLNVGVLLLVVSQALTRATIDAAFLGRLGWLIAAVGIVTQLGVVVWPVGSVDDAQIYSATAARYRHAAD